MLIPNLCHDAHNRPLGTADAWLQQWLPVLMQGPDYRAGHLAIVTTFDEDDNSGDDTVLTTVIAPTVHHVSAATPLTHYSLTRYLAELVGTPPHGEAATAAIAEHCVRPVNHQPPAEPTSRKPRQPPVTTRTTLEGNGRRDRQCRARRWSLAASQSGVSHLASDVPHLARKILARMFGGLVCRHPKGNSVPGGGYCV